ncbi:SGNH/GDSL hydrolase family protein [Kineococcus sp. NUM-3379]
MPLEDADRWVHTWVAAPQAAEPENLPPAPFARPGRTFADTTLRQTVRTTLGGSRLRLRLSNAFGGAPLPLTRAALALPDGGSGARAVLPGTSRAVTFGGRASTTVPVGAPVVSDPVDLAVPAGTDVSVTLYLADGIASEQVTSHPGSRTTSHLLAGDHTGAEELPGAVPVEHWYLLGGLEVFREEPAGALVLLGDSLTDGRGSTTDGNDRWPDLLAARLRAQGRDLAVLNQAAGGNRVLAHGVGPAALARLDRDVLALGRVRWLVLFEGVNDLGTAEATPAAQRAVAADLVAAYEQVVLRARARGIRVAGATTAPFGGHEGYDDPAGLRAAARHEVNTWVREGGRFDAVLDLDAAVRDPAAPDRLLPAYDGGDHLHLNPAGYAALAGAVPLDLFR